MHACCSHGSMVGSVTGAGGGGRRLGRGRPTCDQRSARTHCRGRSAVRPTPPPWVRKAPLSELPSICLATPVAPSRAARSRAARRPASWPGCQGAPRDLMCREKGARWQCRLGDPLPTRPPTCGRPPPTTCARTARAASQSTPSRWCPTEQPRAQNSGEKSTRHECKQHAFDASSAAARGNNSKRKRNRAAICYAIGRPWPSHRNARPAPCTEAVARTRRPDHHDACYIWNDTHAMTARIARATWMTPKAHPRPQAAQHTHTMGCCNDEAPHRTRPTERAVRGKVMLPGNLRRTTCKLRFSPQRPSVTDNRFLEWADTPSRCHLAKPFLMWRGRCGEWQSRGLCQDGTGEHTPRM